MAGNIVGNCIGADVSLRLMCSSKNGQPIKQLLPN